MIKTPKTKKKSPDAMKTNLIRGIRSASGSKNLNAIETPASTTAEPRLKSWSQLRLMLLLFDKLNVKVFGGLKT
jgi:hypothetical protein